MSMNVKRVDGRWITVGAILLVVISGLNLTPGYGQGTTATLSGRVTDASGAAVANANIEIKNTGTDATRTVVPDEQGRYTLSDLLVGTYDIRVTKQGFSNMVRTGVDLTVGATVVVDFSLQVGQQAETITVEAQASQVDTSNSTVGVLTDEKQMSGLPLNGRNFEQLIQLSAGVNTLQGNAFTASGFQGRAPEYSIAGSRPEGQAIQLDDESLQNFWNKGIGSVMGSSLGVEAIGEFQTLTNTYSAQFGGNGGVINAVSKSGSNNFHGSLYEFLRNDALDARTFIDPATIPELRQNQFGGSLGGPIKKDKMFFFVNYEGIQLVQGQSMIAQVPGCNLKPSACIPTTTNPAAAQAIINTLQAYPNATMVVNGQPEATTVGNQKAHENYILGRFDYNISSKDSLLVRYISDKAIYTQPFGGGGFGGGPIPFWPELDFSHTQFATTEWRRIVTTELVNVARVSFSRPGTNEYSGKTALGGLAANGTDPLQYFGGARQDGIVNVTGLSGIGDALQLPFNTTQNRYTGSDDVIWTHGAHNIRMGASVSRLQSNTYMPFFDGAMWSFTGLSSGPFPLLGGIPTVLLYVPLGSYPNRDFRDTEVTPYVQDDWKISRKLTLNLGLRWEFVTNPTDAHNELYYVTNVATASPTTTPPYYTHISNAMASNPAWRNWDPRFGFAYDPFADHKTSIRGGFGIFHSPIGVENIAPGFWASYPWEINALPGAIPFVGARYPNIPAPGAINVAKPSAQPAWDYDAPSTPYVMQYNLNIQRELARGMIFSVGYIGSHGLHLLTGQEANPPLVCSYAQGPGCSNPSYANGGAGGYFGYGTPGDVSSNPDVNAGLGSFANLNPEAWSRYNAMLISVTKRFAQNYQLTASYNWSRCIDNGGYLGSFNAESTASFTDPYNLNLDKAVCAFNQSHVFKLNGLVALPFHGNQFVEGWQITTIVTLNSGLPVNVEDGYDEATGGSTVALVPRPNYVSGCQQVVGKVDEWFNPNCYALEAPGTLGNLGRNTVNGPGFKDVDFALLKDTRLRENMNLQFRAEFFNILNIDNYGLPNISLFEGGGIRNPLGGQITTEAGKPRQIQFALKLVF